MSNQTVSSPLTCPQCQAALNSADAVCPSCGANIALYILLAEREWQERAAGSRELPRPTSVEQLVPRLGDYLLRQGYLSPAQLQAAVERQSCAEGAVKPRLGQTLVEMGLLSRQDLDQVIAEQVVELQAALLEANHTLEKRVAERTRELETALARLSEFNQLKANFVANVSHELRTPLAKIKGYVALMADQTLGPLTSDQEEALRVTTQASGQLEQLINDLIAYAQTAKGEISLQRTPLSVPLLAAFTLQRSAAKAEKKAIRLSAETPADLPPILGDESKLQWVLVQLLDNALKFTPDGGQVILCARLSSPGRLLLGVRDTGIGIPANRQAEIFEPFQQLDGSSTRRYGGTGLGLTLVRKIVEAHGSEVHVESNADQGSFFSFSLPIAPRGQV